jgi:predicted ATPase/DNA-binding XRE family transcriptional regulator/Tfp pilus assembly protein PilF
MDGPQSFGQWLRHRRRELDLTQDALARQVGCARVTIRKLEADEIRPSRQLAELLAEQLGIPPQEREKFVRFGRGGSPASLAPPGPQHNLPNHPSSFIGRERELAAVQQLLHHSHLVTLTGAGGIGKTRLAMEAARELIDAHAYPDGVWWVELAPLRDPALVVKAVANVRDVHETSNQPLVDTLASHLRAQHLLLVLDNCEHLILACAQLADRLLSACPQMRILATSREALDILGETTWQVPSLTLPERQHELTAAALSRFECIRLFADRSRLVQPAFEATDQNAKSVAQICRRLSGMPLAIELAAARVKMMSVDEIARRLDDRFDLLTTGSRTALPRQQTLRATIDWSFDLLSEPERILFRRLSVFAGGFTLPGAEAATSDAPVAGHPTAVIDGQPVLALLGQLVNKSLITVEQHPGDDALPTRYGMLETVREYARQKLEAADESGAIQDRHLDYYVRLAEAAEPELLSARQVQWFHQLQEEIDNIRAAMQRSVENDAVDEPHREAWRREAGLRLAAALVWFLEGAYRREASERMQQMLALSSSMAPTQGRARALTGLGFILWELSLYAEARARLEEALPLLRQLGDEPGQAWAHVFLGLVTINQGDNTAAKGIFEEGIAIAIQCGRAGQTALGAGLALYGDFFVNQGDLVQAKDVYDRGVAILAELGEKNLRGHPVRQIGYIVLRHGDFEQARASFKESLLLNRQAEHVVGMTACLMAFAALAVEQEDYPRAARLAGAVEARLAEHNAPFFARDEVEYRHYLTALRARLPPADFAAAYAAGRAMAMDEAVEYALGQAN